MLVTYRGEFTTRTRHVRGEPTTELATPLSAHLVRGETLQHEPSWQIFRAGEVMGWRGSEPLPDGPGAHGQTKPSWFLCRVPHSDHILAIPFGGRGNLVFG